MTAHNQPYIPAYPKEWINPLYRSTPTSAHGSIQENIEKELEKSDIRWLKQVVDSLEAMKAWPANWDSYDSDAPDRMAIESAISFIKTFYRIINLARSMWLPPHVTASSEGEVVFEWWKKNKKITLYITKNDISFIKVNGENIHDMEDGVFSIADTKNYMVLWQWLLS